MARMGTSMNMDGIWGGNMYAGGAGAILPNKITSKHNFRYVPNMHGLDIVKKLRTQLDQNGYSDVQMKLIGDVPWAKSSGDTDISHAVDDMYDQFSVGREGRVEGDSILNGGYWPAYLFTNAPTGQKLNDVKMPIDGGSVGTGGRAHAANEYWVIEGAGRRYGMAGAEEAFAALIYNFAHTSHKK
jgi:acetylornithine deacetylase/succinyl-diaminopimelate desuccinylase-like protein